MATRSKNGVYIDEQNYASMQGQIEQQEAKVTFISVLIQVFLRFSLRG